MWFLLAFVEINDRLRIWAWDSLAAHFSIDKDKEIMK